MDAAEAGKWMRAERERRGWSTGELAKRAKQFADREGLQMKLTQQSISNFEQAEAKRIPVWMRHVRMAFDSDKSAPSTKDLLTATKVLL